MFIVSEMEKVKAEILNIAHRGCSSLYPENTLSSFRKALEIGVDGIELDVRFTKDKEIVIIHDPSVDRTTNGKGRVSELTLKQIKKLSIIERKSGRLTQERIPLLKEVIDLIKNKTTLWIEMKEEGGEEEIIKLLEREGVINNVVLISFNPQSLKKVKEIDPLISTGIIVGNTRGTSSNFLERVLGCYAEIVDMEQKFINEEIVKVTHSHGRMVGVWTVNERKKMKKFIEMGAEVLTTDYPQVLKELLV